MRQSRITNVGKAACAAFLSCLLAASPILDGMAAKSSAFAAEGSAQQADAAEQSPAEGGDASKEGSGGAPVDADSSAGVQTGAGSSQGSGQLQQELPLDGSDKNTGTAPSDGEASAPSTRAPQTTGDHVSGDVPLSKDQEPAKVGTIVVDGVKYVVNADGQTATVAGWHGEDAPAGDLTIVAKVVSGGDPYRVTAIADEAFKGCGNLKTIALPDGLENIGKDAFAECPSLESFLVGERSESFASFEGMLFDAHKETLVRCPEGKTGSALLPDTMLYLEEDAFNGCAKLTAIDVGSGNVAFASRDNVLYSKDFSVLLQAPARMASVTVALETKTVAARSFAQCEGLESILSLGSVETVETGAFSFKAFADATVALAGGDDYEARKAVWERAGFTRFAEPAEPGEIQGPTSDNGGFIFELLEDYTLAVSWKGQSDPDADLCIPTTGQINGVIYNVSAVAAGGFAGIERLTNVQIRAPISVVGDDAFAGCVNLSSVSFEAGLVAIGSNAFAGTAVESVTIPASVSFVGSRAFSDCSALSRILTFSNDVQVEADALIGCTGTAVYCPLDAEGTYPWNPGLPAAGNHILPYGLSFAADPLVLEVGASADLFEGGICEVPQGCELSYSYPATPLSVENGQATGKKAGTSEVTAALSLDGIELIRAARTVEVRKAVAAEEEGEAPEAETDEPQVINSETALVNAEQETPAMLSYAAALTTDDSFLAEAPTHQMLKYTVLADDPDAVEVSWASDTVTDSNSDAGKVIIPASVTHPLTGKEYVVKGVAASGFNTATPSSIFFGDGCQVAYFGDKAFNDCAFLRMIEMPNSLKTIGSSTFAHCSVLGSIEVPDSVESIGESAFMRCMAASYISIGAGATQLPQSLFYGNFYLETIVVKSSITVFEKDAFKDIHPSNVKVYVPSDRDVELWIKANEDNSYGLDPSNIASFASSELVTVTFKDCGEYQNDVVLSVPKGSTIDPQVPLNPGYGLEGWYEDPEFKENKWDFTQPVTHDMILYSRWVEELVSGDLVFALQPNEEGVAVKAADCARLQGDVIVPDYVELGDVQYPVTAVADSGFTGANIDSIQLPSTLKRIGYYSFTSSRLKSVNWESLYSLEEIGTVAFLGTDLAEVTIPASVKLIKRAAFHSCKSLVSVEFESGSKLETIPDECFNLCSSLVSIVFPEKLKTIDYTAFNRCASLASVDLPESLEYIGTTAFLMCSLSDVIIPSSVTAIGTRAFESNTSLIAVSLPANLQVLGENAFNADPLTTISARGSMAPVAESLTSSAFGSLDKSNVTVILPGKSDDGSETFEQMKAAWESYGFSVGNIFLSSGTLPTENNTENARWELHPDGALLIECTKPGAVIQNLGWIDDACSENWWAPVRKAVKSVTVDSSVDATDMVCWFADMTNLSKVNIEAIPSSVKDISALFLRCSNLKSLPEGFTIPDTVTTCRAMFADCSSLEYLPTSFRVSKNIAGGDGTSGLNNMFMRCSSLVALPAGFEIPQSVTELSGMFLSCASLVSLPESMHLPDNATRMHGLFRGCASLRSLPSDFTIPSKASAMGGMFEGCSSLEYLPENFRILSSEAVSTVNMFYGCKSLRALPDGFTLPDTTTETYFMFYGCTSLSCLPDGFTIPKSVTSDYRMFENCASLVRLPDNFDMPEGWPGKDPTIFLHAEGVNLPMYYAGNSEKVLNYPWSQVNRTLVRPQDAVQGAKTITLNVKDADEAGPGSYWTTAYTDGSGMLAEPAYAPSRGGMVFTLWYADPECTQRVDFSQAFASDTTIYGKLEVGTLGGALPTVGNAGSAFWTLSDAGTLYIRGNGKIADLGWPSSEYDDSIRSSGHWAPYNSKVLKASMSPAVKAEATREWFSGMENLVDVQEVFIPEDAKVTTKMFFKCSSLASLPDGFKLPDVTERCLRMFGDCTSLSKLPDGFTIPSKVVDANAMFLRSGIVTLPEGMSLPVGLKSARYMFSRCSQLASLPSSFLIAPDATVDLNSLFANCVSLSSLPEGFSVPSTLVSMNNSPDSPIKFMFKNCYSLRSLPMGLDVPEGFLDQTFSCDMEAGEQRIPTYYSGNSAALLNYDWASDNRVLINDPADRNLYEVTYKLVNEDGTWATRSTALSDERGMVANPGDPQHGDMGFTGWCIDENCLEPFDFSTSISENKTLYGKWIKHGGRDKEVGEGQLPVVPGSGEAWWQITIDGALAIAGSGEIQTLWTFKPDVEGYSNSHWRLYRNDVISIYMSDGVTTQDMSCWFANMDQLIDASGVFIPEKCRAAQCLFYRSSKLVGLSSDFGIPAHVVSGRVESIAMTNIASMFAGCSSLENLPDGFTIPYGVTTAYWLFGDCWKLKSLPDEFTIPDSVVHMHYMFKDCVSLKNLPSHFRLSEKKDALANRMFSGCSSLSSLPEGFYIPDTISLTNTITGSEQNYGSGGMGYMFYGCTSLTVFPDSFDFPLDVAEESTLPFGCSKETKTYFNGAADSAVMRYSKWADNKRVVVTSLSSTEVFVECYLPDSSGTQKPWMRETVSLNSQIAEPVAPGREGFAFVGWYTDENCTTKAAFPLTVNENMALYAKYAVTSGSLPTVRDGVEGEEASWSFDKGTLTIRCDEKGAEIATLWQYPETGGVNDIPRMGHWSPLRDEVTKVVVEGNVRVRSDMRFWFAGMKNLMDISEFRFSDGAGDVTHLFAGCSALTALPNGFVIPEHVVNLDGLFLSCGLQSLPASFKLPQNAVVLAATFSKCRLTSLPQGFSIPSSVKTTSYMFYMNPLKELPSSFRLPDELENTVSMFGICDGLVSLPEGFNIPKKVSNTGSMFSACASLATLPEGFAFEDPSVLTNVANMFSGCTSLAVLPASLDLRGMPSACEGVDKMFNVDGTALATFVAGGDLAKLSVAGSDAASYWLANYNRKLVTNTEDLGGVVTVTFKTKLVGETEWFTWQTMLSDASGRVSDPLFSGKFGYAFDGWYTDPECTQKFDFETDTLSGDASLYGTHVLIVSYEAPAKAKVKMDVTGKTTSADVQIRSHTPVPLKVSQVSCTATNAASEVMDPADLQDIAVSLLTEGSKWPTYVQPGGQALLSLALPAAKPGSPGVLNCTVGLAIPNASVVKLWGDGWSTDLVRLTYTVEPA